MRATSQQWKWIVNSATLAGESTASNCGTAQAPISCQPGQAQSLEAQISTDLAGPGTFLTTAPGMTPAPVLGATQSADFTSEAEIAWFFGDTSNPFTCAGIPNPEVPVPCDVLAKTPPIQPYETNGVINYPDLRAVLYDDESWQSTPVSEQYYPAEAYSWASSEVRSHNASNGKPLQFLATPSMDLFPGISSYDAGEITASAKACLSKYASSLPGLGPNALGYLQDDIAGLTGAGADVFEVQSQGFETSSQYSAVVYVAECEALSAKAKSVFAGLSTNYGSGPGGGNAPPAATIDAAAASVASPSPLGTPAVKGFWLNDPAYNPQICPNCKGPFPAVALPVLQNMP